MSGGRDAEEKARVRARLLAVRGALRPEDVRARGARVQSRLLATKAYRAARTVALYAALPGQTYPELIVRIARGEKIEPHVGDFRAGVTFTRYFWQLELDSEMRPTGREIV